LESKSSLRKEYIDMKKLIWLILLICIIALQCEKDNLKSKLYDFTGTWEFENSVGEVNHYIRTLEFGDEYGFTIFENGSFVEHKNAGWCGTPPITYADFEGNWTQQSDSILRINVDFWGGEEIYELKIFDVSENTLQATRKNIETVFTE